MLAYLLALAVGLGSFALYMAAFFFPEVHRKNDFIWSGVGLFYALVLWVCAGQIRGALLLGEMAGVALLGWLAWQTFWLRRGLAPEENQTPLPEDWSAATFLDQARSQIDSLLAKTPIGPQLGSQSSGRPSTTPTLDVQAVRPEPAASVPPAEATLEAEVPDAEPASPPAAPAEPASVPQPSVAPSSSSQPASAIAGDLVTRLKDQLQGLIASVTRKKPSRPMLTLHRDEPAAAGSAPGTAEPIAAEADDDADSWDDDLETPPAIATDTHDDETLLLETPPSFARSAPPEPETPIEGAEAAEAVVPEVVPVVTDQLEGAEPPEAFEPAPDAIAEPPIDESSFEAPPAEPPAALDPEAETYEPTPTLEAIETEVSPVPQVPVETWTPEPEAIEAEVRADESASEPEEFATDADDPRLKRPNPPDPSIVEAARRKEEEDKENGLE